VKKEKTIEEIKDLLDICHVCSKKVDTKKPHIVLLAQEERGYDDMTTVLGWAHLAIYHLKCSPFKKLERT